MRNVAAVIAVLVVSAGLATAVSGSAVGDRTPGDSARDVRASEPPDLPEQWGRTYGASGDDVFADLVRADDGGYLLVGWTERKTVEGWVMKVDAEGENEWERTLGGPGVDRLWGVARTDDGFLLAGRTDADGRPEGWVVELGPDGEVRDERTTGPGAFNAVVRDGSAEGSDDDPEYVLAGWTNDGGVAGLALKLDADLSSVWERRYPTPDGYRSGRIRAIVSVEGGEGDSSDSESDGGERTTSSRVSSDRRSDGGYYLAGKITGDSDDAWAMRIDSDGERVWQTTAGGPARDDVWAAAPGDGAEGGFVLAGETASDGSDSRAGWLVKFGPDGGVEWERQPGSEGTRWFDSAMRVDGGYLFTGSANDGPTGTVDGYVLKTDGDGSPLWEAYYGTSGWDKPWPAIRAHGGGYLLAGQTSGSGNGMDGWLLRVGSESAIAEATSTRAADGGVGGETATAETVGASTEGTDTADGESSDGTATTGTTATESVPGFGIGVVLVGLAVLLLATRR